MISYHSSFFLFVIHHLLANVQAHRYSYLHNLRACTCTHSMKGRGHESQKRLLHTSTCVVHTMSNDLIFNTERGQAALLKKVLTGGAECGSKSSHYILCKLDVQNLDTNDLSALIFL